MNKDICGMLMKKGVIDHENNDDHDFASFYNFINATAAETKSLPEKRTGDCYR